MARYTITPWRTQADLLQVRAQLYRLDTQAQDARRHTVDRVMAWKLRGNLPHAVESTALLVDAILHHHATPSNSSFSIRAVYSAAFTRFVTGFCDIGRAREGNLNPSSMLEIARQIDMPAHFVALRHEATHEELPALGRLVAATQAALEWLWRVYWSRLEEPLLAKDGESANSPTFKEEARRLLRSFRSVRREALKKRKQATAEHQAELEGFGIACTTLCEGGEASLDAFVEILVDEKLLLPSSRELGASMSVAFALWDDLLSTLSERLGTFRKVLLRRLLRALAQSSHRSDEDHDVEKEAVFLWLGHLTFGSAGQEAEQAELMRWCCLYPSYWTQKLGEEVLDTAEEWFVEAWKDMFEASSLQSDVAGAHAGGERESAPGQDAMDVERLDLERLTDTAAEETMGGWRRAAVPPQVPIGVVA